MDISLAQRIVCETLTRNHKAEHGKAGRDGHWNEDVHGEHYEKTLKELYDMISPNTDITTMCTDCTCGGQAIALG